MGALKTAAKFGFIEDLPRQERVAGNVGSGAGVVDEFVPDAFGFEDEFDGFADGALSGMGFGGIVRDFFYVGDGVTDCDGEADSFEDGDVGEIVTDKGDFGVFYAGFGEDFFVGGHFVRNLHVDVVHLHFVGAAEEGGAFAAGDAAGADAGGVGGGGALAVVGGGLFHFEGGAVRVREQEHAAVGHGGVDVH